jgi:hypothetical protein
MRGITLILTLFAALSSTVTSSQPYGAQQELVALGRLQHAEEIGGPGGGGVKAPAHGIRYETGRSTPTSALPGTLPDPGVTGDRLLSDARFAGLGTVDNNLQVVQHYYE